MIKWFFSLFAKQGRRELIPGDRWGLVSTFDDGSPWPVTKPLAVVVIVDVRDGWVRYNMGGCFNDCRMKEEMFRGIYAPVSSNVQVQAPCAASCARSPGTQG